jgi:hypothetical protein
LRVIQTPETGAFGDVEQAVLAGQYFFERAMHSKLFLQIETISCN